MPMAVLQQLQQLDPHEAMTQLEELVRVDQDGAAAAGAGGEGDEEGEQHREEEMLLVGAGGHLEEVDAEHAAWQGPEPEL